MADAKNKTQITDVSVDAFLNTLSDEHQRADSRRVVEIMQRASGEVPKMWGPAIVGFGVRYMKYESGREMDWMEIGFSPRKGNITLYVLSKTLDQDELLAKIGKHKAKGGCLHIKKLTDIDETVLEKLIKGYLVFVKKGGI